MWQKFLVQDEVEKDAKAIRAAKNAKTKKTLEKFQAIQKDLQQTVSEVSLKMVPVTSILFLYFVSNLLYGTIFFKDTHQELMLVL